MQYKISPKNEFINYFIEKECEINYLYNCYWMTKKKIDNSWFESNPEFKNLETADSKFILSMPIAYKNPDDEKESFFEKREKFRHLFMEEIKEDYSLDVISEKENDQLIKSCSFEQLKMIINNTKFQDLRQSYHSGMFAVYREKTNHENN